VLGKSVACLFVCSLQFKLYLAFLQIQEWLMQAKARQQPPWEYAINKPSLAPMDRRIGHFVSAGSVRSAYRNSMPMHVGCGLL